MKKILSFLLTVSNEFLKADFPTFINSVRVTCGFKSNRNIYKLRRGLVLNYEPGTLDLMVIRECTINNLYSKFLKEKQLDVVIDMGSHKGYFIAGLIYNGIKVNRVLCVDPVADNLLFFKKSMKLNKRFFKNVKHIILENSAVSNNNIKNKFYITNNSVNSSLKDPSMYDRVIKKISVATIDPKKLFVKHKIKNVDLLKIDIEGSEFDIFNPKYKSEMFRAKYIVMEIHPNKKNNKYKIINELTKYNYLISYPNPAYKNLIFASKNTN